MTHTGLPIMVSLANRTVSFSCRINYQNMPGFTVRFFHMDLHGKKSLEMPLSCQRGPGAENQTMDCAVTLSLPNASATGTYYCLVRGSSQEQRDSVFILVKGKALGLGAGGPGRRNSHFSWETHRLLPALLPPRHRVPATFIQGPGGPDVHIYRPAECPERAGHSSTALEEGEDHMDTFC